MPNPDPYSAIPGRPQSWEANVEGTDDLMQRVYHDLVEKGVPAGIAMQQAGATLGLMRNSLIDSSGYNQGKLMNDARRGYTGLSPTQIYGLQSLFADPARAESFSNVLSSPTAHRLLSQGMGSFNNADPDTRYQFALKAFSEEIKNSALARGVPISNEEARQIAISRYLGDRAHFDMHNDVANQAGSPAAVDRLTSDVGTNLGLGAGMHAIQDTLFGGAAPNVGWRGLAKDLKESVYPFGGATSELNAAKNALTIATRSGDPIAMANARKAMFEAAKGSMGSSHSALGAPMTALRGVPLVFGAAEAMGRGYRGENALDFGKRMLGIGYPGNIRDVDVNDALTLGSIPAYAAAQGYLFNRAPTLLGAGLKTNPLGALTSMSYKAPAVMALPGAFDRIMHSQFGDDNAKAHAARRLGNMQADRARHHELGGWSTHLDPSGYGGALEGMDRRGLFNLIRTRGEGAGVGDYVMGGLQTAQDALMTPARLAAQYGVAAPLDILSTAINAGAGRRVIDPTIGSRAQSFVDPTKLEDGLVEAANSMFGDDPKKTYEKAAPGMVNKAIGSQNKINDEIDRVNKLPEVQPIGAK